MDIIFHKVVLLNREEIVIREIKDGDNKSVCPVCGFLFSGDLPWSMVRSVDESTRKEYGDAFGAASFDICPCCNTQYGLDDQFAMDGNPTMPQIWGGLRSKWLDKTGWTEEALRQLKANLDIIVRK